MTTPNDPTRSHGPLDAVIAGYLLAVEAGGGPDRQEWLDRHPEHAQALRAFFADLDRMNRVASPLRLADGWSRPAPSMPMTRPCRRPSATSATTSCWVTIRTFKTGAGPRPSATSATTSCWRRSPGAGWGSSPRRARCRSTGWWR